MATFSRIALLLVALLSLVAIQSAAEVEQAGRRDLLGYGKPKPKKPMGYKSKKPKGYMPKKTKKAVKPYVPPKTTKKAVKPYVPTKKPTAKPYVPTKKPTAKPYVPTKKPTAKPYVPTKKPTAKPYVPTKKPTAKPYVPTTTKQSAKPYVPTTTKPLATLPSTPRTTRPGTAAPFVPGAIVMHGSAVEQCDRSRGWVKFGPNPPVLDCVCCPNAPGARGPGGCASQDNRFRRYLRGCAVCNDFLICDSCRDGFVKGPQGSVTLPDRGGNPTVLREFCVPA